MKSSLLLLFNQYVSHKSLESIHDYFLFLFIFLSLREKGEKAYKSFVLLAV